MSASIMSHSVAFYSGISIILKLYFYQADSKRFAQFGVCIPSLTSRPQLSYPLFKKTSTVTDVPAS